MSDLWRKTLVYLGLVEEPEEHDEHELTPAEPDPHTRPRQQAPPRRSAPVRDEAPTVRPLRPADTHVRPVEGGAPRVAIIRAVSFEDARTVGERYRSYQPVLLDLGQVDKRTGQRLIDFISGTVFALRGRIVGAGTRSYLLVPDGVEVPSDERRRLADLGYPVRANASPTEQR